MAVAKIKQRLTKQEFQAFLEDLKERGYSVKGKMGGWWLIGRDVTPLRAHYVQLKLCEDGIVEAVPAKYKASWGEIDNYREYKPRRYKNIEKLRKYVINFLETGRVNLVKGA